ncbi:MAG: molybdopterin-binding protein [Myxococcota bacterium]
MSTAGIVVIGNEVLSGQVEEANGRYLIRELRELGVQLMRVVIIPDDSETIARDVRSLADTYTHVFTSGGVGSTHDDLTMTAVAQAFDIPLEPHPVLMNMIENHFGDGINDAVRRMGQLPQGAELLGLNELRVPLVRVRNVYIFPGVPKFMRMKFEWLKPRLADTPFVLKQVYLNVGEERIAERLAALDAAHTDVAIGSYPRFDTDTYKTKITLESRDGARVEAALADLLDRLDAEWVVQVD